MSRISIDVTPEEHKKLKALAALQGKSIKDFVLECTLGAARASTSDAALLEIERFLEARIRGAQADSAKKRTVEQVFEKAYRKSAGRRRDA